MEMDELDDFYKLHRFKPSKEDAVNYYLPRLLAGSRLPQGADMLIRHADVYAREPKDLAAEYAPVPSAVSSGDRFFFTTCKHKSGKDARIARGAGAGTWAVQRTENVYHEGVKAGELKHLSFKKGKASTGWVMEEYRCLLPEAVFAGGEKVLCKIHLAPNACAAARQESDAYKLRQERAEPPVPEPVTVTASAHAQKMPAPVYAADDLSICKRMRLAVPVPEPDEVEHEDCQVRFAPGASAQVQKMWTSAPVPPPDEDSVWFTPAAPVSSPTASTFAAEADDDKERLSCSWEELAASISLEPEDLLDDDWKSQVQEEQTLPAEAANNVQQLVLDQEDIQQLDIDQQRPWDDEEAEPKGCGMVQEEEQTPRIQAETNVAQLVASTDDWELSEELHTLLAEHGEEEAELYKTCNYNALHAPSLQGRNPFFSFGAVN